MASEMNDSPECPLCHCGEYYGVHHPDCPVVREFTELRERIAELEAENADLRDQVQTMMEDGGHREGGEGGAVGMADSIYVWANEDGDRWFAEGHHSDEAMREAAARTESEANWVEVTAADFADGRVFRGWLRPIDPDDEESPMERVDEGTPSAQAWTVLDAEPDWDAIESRPQRRPEWA